MNLFYKIVIFILRLTRLANILPDKLYLKLLYRRVMGKKLNLDNPKTFNEKLNWLKLYDRKPEYSRMVDKYEAKKYVASIIGEECIITTYGVWERFDDIDFNQLPDQFVLKCTHDSGSIYICRDKSKFDFKGVRNTIEKSLSRNYYYPGREWVYKDVKPRILIEKMITDNNGVDINDYKFFNFNGSPKFIQVDIDRFTNHRRNFYDLNWQLLDVELTYERTNSKIEKPQNLEKMVVFSRLLAKNIPFCRTDFYSIGDKIYFGEITFYPEAGFKNFSPELWNKNIGDWIPIK